MAQIEPLDVENDYEDKENLLQHSNVLPRTPCSEKGYEELDVSELSMKLRYSITPTSSPMSKSYTANCRDNKHYEDIDDSKNVSVLNSNNLTHSLNSAFKVNETLSSKTYPLQPLPTDLQNPLRRSLDVNAIDTTITFSLSENHSEDDSLLQSPTSSTNLTPEATTPTKEIIKDGGSPIMRGLKSVFSMFRSSQSPIPSAEVIPTQHALSPTTEAFEAGNPITQPLLISTPISKTKDSPSRRNSPLKDSLTFKDDLEKELLWKDESTILFKDEKIPIHKLFLQQPLPVQVLPTQNKVVEAGNNLSVEYMDISQNDSIILDTTMTDFDAKTARDVIDNIHAVESDGEFVDCETTFTKNESQISNPVDESINENQEIIETELQNNEQTNKLEVSETHHVVESCLNESLKYVDHGETKVFEQSVNEIMAITHDSTLEVIKNIDSSIEMLKSNQFNNNLLTVDLCVNYDDNKDLMPDLVNVPTVVSSISIDVMTTSKHNDNVDTFECLSKTMDNLNTEMPCTSTHTYCNEKDKNAHINNDGLGVSNTMTNNFRKSLNNVLDTSAKQCEVMDISADNSKIIEDIIVDGTYEIITKNNNDISHLDKLKQQKALVEIVDLDLTVSNNDNIIAKAITDQKTSDIHSTKLCTDDIEKQETVLFDVNTVEGTAENDIAYVKSEIICLKDNEQRKTLPYELTENIEDNDISSPNDLLFNVKEDNKLVAENERTVLPENIPLPCDTEMEQELFTDNKSIVNNSKTEFYKLSDANDIKCEKKEINVSKSINQSIFEANTCEVDNANLNNAIESGNNEIQMNEHEIVIKNPDVIDDRLNNDDQENVKVKSNVVPQRTNEDTFDIEKSKATIDSSNMLDNLLDNIGSNNTSENIKLTYSVSSENVPNVCSDTSIVSDNHIKMEYDEEIITSASSSPYVSVTDMALTSIGQKDNLENIANPFETKSKINVSPPISPQPYKGYNFNFDDIQDPFATKTKIRLSPTPESPKFQSCTPLHQNENCKNDSRKKESHKNKRKSHSEKIKKCLTNTKQSNRTLKSIVKDNEDDNELDDNEKISNATLSKDIKKDNLDLNQDTNNTGVTLNETTSFTRPDVIKTYENEQNLFDTYKIHDISLLKEEMVIDNSSITKFHSIGNIEVLDKCIDRTIDLELKDNEDEKEIHNSNQTYVASVHNEENLGNEEIKGFHDINISANEFKNIDFDNKSSVKNEIDTMADFAKPFLTDVGDVVGDLRSEKKIEHEINNDIPMTEQIKQPTPPPKECDLSIVHKIKINTSSETEQFKEKSFSVSLEESTSDLSNATCLLKNTDIDRTVAEVNTEDEDTIEGPFLEADGFSDHLNVRCFDSDSKMQFDFPPKTENDDNIDKGELFIDAEAFEFLLNQNQTNVITNSGKESLFLKFDPLYSKRISSDDVLAAMSKIQRSQSTPIKVTKSQVTKEDFQPESIQASSSKTSTTFDEYRDDPDVSSTLKPMMVVNPAVNPVVSPRKMTPKINRQSLTFTSPAIAVIDRLLCLSGNNSLMDQNTSFPPRKHNDTDIAITQLRELLAEKEIHVHNLRLESKELKDRLASLETQMKSLETEGEKRLKKVNDLNEHLAEKTKINRSMAVVVEEYERTIASLITEMEQEKKRNAEERNILIKERDEQTTHLASMEVSFNDLHSKYEKSKQIILSMKANEDTYKKSIKDFDENFVKMQNNYELLKQHATLKLNHANQELEKFNKSHESEVLKLNAMIKRKEMHITSLEETLGQKTKANEELAAICDELINKVG